MVRGVMKDCRKIVFGYVIVVGVLFLASYLFFSLRESRLYLLLMAINLPGSLVVVPGIEELALAVGWVIGGPVHVWTTQLACMTVNGGFLAGIISIARRFRDRDN
jgi:hypothetical protein